MMLREFPFSTLNFLRPEFDRVLRGAFEPLQTAMTRRAGTPALNVWEENDTLVAEAEVPGLKLENIEIFVVGNELTIKGRRPAETSKDARYLRQERPTGEFSRVVTLPVEVNSAAVEATLLDGILTVRLPKAESMKARKIEVRAG